MTKLTVVGGTVLSGSGLLEEANVTIEDGIITGVSNHRGDATNTIDASGKWVLPGIVDIHGDAFERQILPRSGAGFPVDLALLETDRQMIANGITTAFHGLTYSWEPGLRGRDAAVAMVETLGGLKGRLACDTRLHLRHEAFNLDAVDEICGWMADGVIDLLAFNDHQADTMKRIQNPVKLARYADRSGLDKDAFEALLMKVQARKDEVPAAIAKLAEAARERDIPMLSHDDVTAEQRKQFHDMGCDVAEFPMTLEAISCASEMGNPVVMGAPNVLRGGSHNGSIGATDMIQQGFCTILASDYYYPSQLLAAFHLFRKEGVGFGEAWSLVSRAPALACGLEDRGEIATGRRADLILVDPEADWPEVSAVVVAGRVVQTRAV